MYAVIDIGSNTIRLSLYKVENKTITLMLNKKITAGLAGYIENKQMSLAGIEKGEEALAALTSLLSYIHVRRLVCFATAPLRGIDNAEEVKARFEKACGAQITILSGEEEAELDYFGAKQTFTEKEGLIVDIGGGSTELVYFKDDGPVFSKSLPFGSLVMYRRHVKDILPLKIEMLLIEKEVVKMLEKTFPEKYMINQICGIGGTIRGCGKVLAASTGEKKKTEKYTPQDLAGLLKMKKSAAADLILKTEPERIHTILPGACILHAVSLFFDAKSIRVSKTGVREGCLAKLLAENAGED
ncbi:MAG TPA: hypothetical protein O0X70_03280 [Methanocorpusculum sp.]|nr:hypothetical protein [Methanocorpusculum sp.]